MPPPAPGEHRQLAPTHLQGGAPESPSCLSAIQPSPAPRHPSSAGRCDWTGLGTQASGLGTRSRPARSRPPSLPASHPVHPLQASFILTGLDMGFLAELSKSLLRPPIGLGEDAVRMGGLPAGVFPASLLPPLLEPTAAYSHLSPFQPVAMIRYATPRTNAAHHLLGISLLLIRCRLCEARCEDRQASHDLGGEGRAEALHARTSSRMRS